jgi:predicted kinase
VAAALLHAPYAVTDVAPRRFDRAQLPEGALVVLVGAAGCGKSTFARRHFAPTEVVSSDECRRLVSDDEASQEATRVAFPVFHAIVRGRLAMGRLTVADATNLQPHTRARLLTMAAARERPAVAMVFDHPLDLCLSRAAARDRVVDPDVIRRHHEQVQAAKEEVPREGFARIWFVGADDAVREVAPAPAPPPPADRPPG